MFCFMWLVSIYPLIYPLISPLSALGENEKKYLKMARGTNSYVAVYHCAF